MRQKTLYASMPDAVRVDRTGRNATISLTENAQEHDDQYEADEYTLTVPYSPTLEYRVKADPLTWLIRAKELDYEKAAQEVRAKRDVLLANTDWTQLTDVTLDESTRAAYAVYRQTLRDVPQQAGFPYTVVWPEAV